MKLHKKLAIALVCVMLFTLSACGQRYEETVTTDGDSGGFTAAVAGADSGGGGVSNSGSGIGIETAEAAEDMAAGTDSKGAEFGDADGEPIAEPAAEPAAEVAVDVEPAVEGEPVDPTFIEDTDIIEELEPEPTEPVIQPSSLILTAGEWNDNDNWPFFQNLIHSQLVSFPSFGVNPCYRVRVSITDNEGNPVANQEVLLESAGEVFWKASTDKNGIAYLFGDSSASEYDVICNQEIYKVSMQNNVETDDSENNQNVETAIIDDVSITMQQNNTEHIKTQVMFILDTTGSMGDEIAYLQKDFSAITRDVGANGVEYSVNFYRDTGDEYVTKCNKFTDDIGDIQAKINAEYADGGGDTPEAVAQILEEAITNNNEWSESANKIAFLIFDAPPHSGTDDTIISAVKSAAKRGIKLIPVVASNADRETELFGRAIAICTNGTYVFLTDDSGVGESHLEPIIGDYEVELLHDIIVRIINENLA